MLPLLMQQALTAPAALAGLSCMLMQLTGHRTALRTDT